MFQSCDAVLWFLSVGTWNYLNCHCWTRCLYQIWLLFFKWNYPHFLPSHMVFYVVASKTKFSWVIPWKNPNLGNNPIWRYFIYFALSWISYDKGNYQIRNSTRVVVHVLTDKYSYFSFYFASMAMPIIFYYKWSMVTSPGVFHWSQKTCKIFICPHQFSRLFELINHWKEHFLFVTG